jgi:hypothetical protein
MHPLQIAKAVKILIDRHDLTKTQHQDLQSVTMKTLSGSPRKPNVARIPDKGSKFGCSRTWSITLGVFATRVMGCKVTQTQTRCLLAWAYVLTSYVSILRSAPSRLLSQPASLAIPLTRALL